MPNMGNRKLNRRQKWRIDKIQQERQERAKKRDHISESLLENGQLGPEQRGLVIAHYGVQVAVESLDESKTVQRCHIRANIEQLVTGDKVIFCAGEPTGVIVAKEERHSEIIRPDNYGKLKPVAANIDQIIIVIAPEPQLHTNLLDRYLIAAEASHIQPIILLNKLDTIHNLEEFIVDECLQVYTKLGYPLLTCSTKTQDGLEQLQTLLENKISIFAGQSGVGKSSLVNALLPEAALKTGELSDTGKGSHTTTTAKLFHFPQGGSLIDSPGIREFSLWHLEADSLLNYFIEFRPFLGYCRFRDCSHQHEPGCKIQEAIAAGDISQQRFDSYLHILNSIPENAY